MNVYKFENIFNYLKYETYKTYRILYNKHNIIETVSNIPYRQKYKYGISDIS